MKPRLAIRNDYPPDWKARSDEVWAGSGHRCVRCGHPYKKGTHGTGEWSPCDDACRHHGPLAFQDADGAIVEILNLDMRSRDAGCIAEARPGVKIVARWRIGTVHHMDGDKANCRWWNLLPLCQRCHLEIQGRVVPDIPYFLEHSPWIKPYVAGFYAFKYEGAELTREQVIKRLDQLLAYERLA